MKNYLNLFLFLFIIQSSWSQDIKRQIISGQVIVSGNDVEGINIFNTSTHEGTITNKQGSFTVEAGLGDKLEVSALQFKKKTIIINSRILKNKSFKILMVEAINTLDEVVVLPYELTGNIDVDINDSEVIEPLAFSFGSYEDYDFSADYKTEVENIAMNNVVYNNGLNFVNIFSQLLMPLLKNEHKHEKKTNGLTESAVKSLSNKYTVHFLSKSFSIPEEKTGLFVAYVENNGLTDELLKEGNEMRLIAFLHEKSKLYLSEQD